MYVKFFRNKKGGSIASIKYLLNEREQNGTAKIIKGNRGITEDIIKSISNKQKVTVGVLSFEERDIPDAHKKEIMRNFEKTIFAGMDEDEYNILWVQHTDKGRLELNFVIPKIHLPTKLSFNPYFHKLDFPRIDMFEDICNIKYNLSSKKDPLKAQTLSGDKKEINLIKDYEQLDHFLHQLVQSGDIQNRDQMIELLEESGIEVTRKGKDYISIKLPESKRAKRYKGAIYNEQFTSLDQIEAISKDADRRAQAFHSRDTSRELEQTIERLAKYNDQKAQHHREKYQRNNERHQVAEQESIQPKADDMDISNNSTDISIRRNDTDGIHTKISKMGKMDSARRNEARRQRNWIEVHQEQRAIYQRRQTNNIHQNRRVENETRRRAIQRNRERAEAKRRADQEAHKARAEFYRVLEKTARSVREKSWKDSIAASREYRTITEQSNKLIEHAAETTGQSDSIAQLSEELSQTARERKQTTSAIFTTYQRISEFGSKLRERISNASRQSGSFIRRIREIIGKRLRPKPIKPQPRYKMKMRM